MDAKQAATSPLLASAATGDLWWSRAERVGRQAVASVVDEAGAPRLLVLRQVLGVAAMKGERPVTLDAAAGLVLSHWSASGDYAPQTLVKFTDTAAGFVRRTKRVYRVDLLDEVTADHVRGFLIARTARRGVQPAVSTQYLRRSVVRVFFATARRLGLTTGDPTLDVVLPPRTQLKARPLTDAEIQLGRAFTMSATAMSMGDTREPAAWALAEATATTAEIPFIVIADVDLAGKRVWIPGSTLTNARWGHLTGWGLRIIASRIRHLQDDGADETTPIVYRHGEGSVTGPQTSTCKAIHRTLKRAGLTDPDIAPKSLSSWQGRRVYDATGNLHLVARTLGVTKLETAVRRIGLDRAPYTDDTPPPHRSGL